jgi:hypothetical protein
MTAIATATSIPVEWAFDIIRDGRKRKQPFGRIDAAICKAVPSITLREMREAHGRVYRGELALRKYANNQAHHRRWHQHLRRLDFRIRLEGPENDIVRSRLVALIKARGAASNEMSKSFVHHVMGLRGIEAVFEG